MSLELARSASDLPIPDTGTPADLARPEGKIGRPYPNSQWTEERVGILLREWADGKSATAISVLLGCSRSAVIGKLHRLGAPEPAVKAAVIRNRIYSRQLPEISRVNARSREARYRLKMREARNDEKRMVCARFLARGASPHSVAYRKHLPPLPEMTKSELRRMLREAVQNTAAMQ